MEMDWRVDEYIRYGYPYTQNRKHIKCECCEREIYEGEDYFDFFGDAVCDDCEYDYVLKNFHKYL